MSEATTNNDGRSTINSTAPTRPRNVFRGILATLRDVGQCCQHPYDDDDLRASKLLLRSRKRTPGKSCTEDGRPMPVSLQDIFSRKEFTIIFWFDPRQPHSIQLRSTLSAFSARNDDKLSCLAIFGGEKNAATAEDKKGFKTFFLGTGFLEIGHDDETGQRACASLLKLLVVTQIPSVVVIPSATGRPVRGQEVALEWNGSADNGNEDAALLQRWREGKPGLTFSQGVLSTVIGDSNSACTVS